MLNFFEQFPELIAAASEKEDGSMKIADDKIIGEQNQKNRETFFQKNGIDFDRVVSAGLAHGNNTEIILIAEPKIISQTDALATNKNNIFLTITIADCIPVFFYEKEKGIVALAHAGWKGITENILENTVQKISELGGSSDNLYVALGPGINVCHFEIKEDILEKFADYPEFIIRKEEKIFVDLKGIIKKQLGLLGIMEENIENNETCTYEAENLFSFRRDKPEITQAMIAVIGMKKK